VTKPKLHLDADVSMISLTRELTKRGHDVTRTPNEWMPLDASDEQQLLSASEHGRIVLTFNIRDFMELAQMCPEHKGIILSTQKPMSQLLVALDYLLSETEAEDWIGKVDWLNNWLK
jgi:hypothetical protein